MHGMPPGRAFLSSSGESAAPRAASAAGGGPQAISLGGAPRPQTCARVGSCRNFLREAPQRPRAPGPTRPLCGSGRAGRRRPQRGGLSRRRAASTRPLEVDWLRQGPTSRSGAAARPRWGGALGMRTIYLGGSRQRRLFYSLVFGHWFVGAQLSSLEAVRPLPWLGMWMRALHKKRPLGSEPILGGSVSPSDA